MIINDVTQVFLNNSCYSNNTQLNSIDLYNVPWVNNSMGDAFDNCTNLKSVTHINNAVTNMAGTLYHVSLYLLYLLFRIQLLICMVHLCVVMP